MNNTTNELLIYGAGGFAREVAWLIESGNVDTKAACFISDDAKAGDVLHDLPVLDFKSACNAHPNAKVVIAVAHPEVRQKIAEKVSLAKMQFSALTHDSVLNHESTSIGEGTIICAGNLIMPDVNIGNHVHINLACTVGHDAVIGDYSTISPGVHVSGNVTIGKHVFIGTGASIIQGTSEQPLIIADNTIIAAGACITKPTEANSLYAGVPAVRKK